MANVPAPQVQTTCRTLIAARPDIRDENRIQAKHSVAATVCFPVNCEAMGSAQGTGKMELRSMADLLLFVSTSWHH